LIFETESLCIPYNNHKYETFLNAEDQFDLTNSLGGVREQLFSQSFECQITYMRSTLFKRIGKHMCNYSEYFVRGKLGLHFPSNIKVDRILRNYAHCAGLCADLKSDHQLVL